MATVLSSWLPESFMRPSLASRSSKTNMAEEDSSAPDELALDPESSSKPNGVRKRLAEEEQDAEGEPDEEDEQDDPGYNGAEADEEEYHDAAAGEQSDVEVSQPLQQRRRKSRRALAQQNMIRRRNGNAKAALSDSEASSAAEEEDDDEDEEEAWRADADEDVDGEERDGTDATHCALCGQDENDDPGEDFEDILNCAVCGSKAHRQCAREAHLFAAEDDAADWHCANCLDNEGDGAEGAFASVQGNRRDSAPKIARDLLPYQRGAPKPGSHSIFNTLIVQDDPMDGSRSLRKRKPSVEEDDKPEPRKRQRRATSEAKIQADKTLTPTDAGETTTRGPSPPTARPSRSRGTRRTERQLVTVVEPRTDETLTLAFHLGSDKLRGLDDAKRKRKRREREKQRRQIVLPEMPEVNHYPALQPTSFVMQSLFDRDADDTKSKPYGGILDEDEADTTRTFPQTADRKKFEDARQKAEADWRRKIEAQREAEAAKAKHKTSGPPSKVKCINFAGFEIDTWHAAPYPEEYSRNRVLYICEFCLKYMNSDYVAWRHKLKCPAKHPPGDEIYRDGSISFFEVDGRKNPVYCQNLCLLAKLFLGSKTLYYDVEPFLFYIMTENDEYGCHFVGYFSKEKRPSSLNNVSCILVLPIHQRRGFGNLLIEFSYLLTRVEGKTGSPEKPLSDMGLVTYRAYWRLVMCHQLLGLKEAVSVATLSERTGMTSDDIVCALEGLRALVRDPVSGTYALRLDHAYYKRYIENYDSKGYVKLNSDALIWVPYVMGRDNMHYENAAPLHTVAQREEDSEEHEGAKSNNEDGAGGADLADGTIAADKDDAVMPFPGLSGDSEAPQTRIMPNTPFVDDPAHPASPIPATRFEVFPPLPGTAGRKSRGRPRSGRKMTSMTSSLSFADSPAAHPNGQLSTLRRGRSHLAEEVHGNNDDDDDDAASKAENGNGSPAAGRTQTTDEDVEMGEAE